MYTIIYYLHSYFDHILSILVHFVHEFLPADGLSGSASPMGISFKDFEHLANAAQTWNPTLCDKCLFCPVLAIVNCLHFFAVIMPFEGFCTLLLTSFEDESDDGCYCEDSKLRVLVDACPKPAAATATTTNTARAYVTLTNLYPEILSCAILLLAGGSKGAKELG